MTRVTEVRRVQTETGDHIEPPLDPTWSDLDKLRWKAAVIRLDTGVIANVETSGHDQFSLNGAMFSYGPEDFQGMWSVLNGIRIGARRATESDRP